MGVLDHPDSLHASFLSRDLDADVDRVTQYVCTKPLGGSLSIYREQLVAAVNAHPFEMGYASTGPA
jgi:hypothetical protein